MDRRGWSPPPFPRLKFGPPKYCRGQGPPNSRAIDVVYEKIKSAAQPKILWKWSVWNVKVVRRRQNFLEILDLVCQKNEVEEGSKYRMIEKHICITFENVGHM